MFGAEWFRFFPKKSKVEVINPHPYKLERNEVAHRNVEIRVENNMVHVNVDDVCVCRVLRLDGTPVVITNGYINWYATDLGLVSTNQDL